MNAKKAIDEIENEQDPPMNLGQAIILALVDQPFSTSGHVTTTLEEPRSLITSALKVLYDKKMVSRRAKKSKSEGRVTFIYRATQKGIRSIPKLNLYIS